jgi:hypothetical protein
LEIMKLVYSHGDIFKRGVQAMEGETNKKELTRAVIEDLLNHFSREAHKTRL